MSEGDNLHCITSETGADRSDYGDNSTIYAAGFPGTVSRLSLLWLVDCSSKSDALLSDVLIQLSTSYLDTMQLMRVLDDHKYNHIVSWDEDGRSFTFRQNNLFESTVIASHFKRSKFTSFVRKVSYSTCNFSKRSTMYCTVGSSCNTNSIRSTLCCRCIDGAS